MRLDPRRFLIERTHLIADVEVVVLGNERFIVERREGEATDVVTQTDPRS